MKKILLASGCSFTDPAFVSATNPEIDCSWPKWPEVLAKKLDMNCINLGRNGGGNEYIYSSLLDEILKIKDKSQIGLVIPAWTQCQRKDWQQFYTTPLNYELKDYLKAGGNNEDWYNPYSMKNGWYCRRIDPQGDVYGWIKKSLRYMISLQIVCERYNIPLKQFQMLNLFDGWIHGLSKTDKEILKNKDNPDFVKQYKYPGVDPIKDREKCQKLMLNYDSYINEESFIGWPTLKIFGGFNVEEETLRDPNKIYPNYLTDLLVSRFDVHPNGKGNETIAEFIYDRLG